jgi:hypothetical protein
MLGVPDGALLRKVVASEVDRVWPDPEIVVLGSSDQTREAVVKQEFARQRIPVIMACDANLISVVVFAIGASCGPIERRFMQHKRRVTGRPIAGERERDEQKEYGADRYRYGSAIPNLPFFGISNHQHDSAQQRGEEKDYCGEPHYQACRAPNHATYTLGKEWHPKTSR